MERYVSQSLQAPSVLREVDVETTIRKIRRGDLPYGSDLLELAGQYHPERYCVKHVPAAAVVETPRGTIFMFSVNGRPHSSPYHVREYSPDNLRCIAARIPAPSERIPLLSGIALASTPVSCPELRELAGTSTCLKGFDFDEPGRRATRSSAEFCPNSRAGCTERQLLTWVPYALGLQAQLGADFLVIPDMEFATNTPTPTVTFTTDWEHTFQTMMAFPHEVDSTQLSVTMATQILPCHTCASTIVESGIVRDVHFRELSRYVEEGVVTIDSEDLWSIDYLTGNNVGLVCNSLNTPVVRN